MRRLELLWLRTKVRVLRVGLILHSPLIIAVALALLAGRQQKRGALPLLAIYKDQFEEDVAVLPKTAPEIGLRPISLYYFKQIFLAVAGQSLEGLLESNYYTSPAWDAGKQRYRQTLEPVMRYLRWFLGLRGVISCNFNYIAQQEVAVVCRQLGIPFFIIMKEGMIVPERQADWHRYYPKRYFSGPIVAEAVFTPNAYVARWIDQAPFLDTNAELIPVGIPRIDAYKTARLRESTGNALVVFAFDPVFSFRYFNELYPEPSDPNLVERLQARTRLLYQAILDYAAQHPEVPVVIKTKPRSLVRRSVQPLIDELLGRFANLPNLEVVDSGPAMDLIARARIVVALNSTTVAEAFLARRRVLTPDFGEFFPHQAWHYFHAFPKLAEIFGSIDDLEEAMARDARPPEAEARAFIERQLTFDRELSARSIASEITRLVQPHADRRHGIEFNASSPAE